jgi:hypothetical protein
MIEDLIDPSKSVQVFWFKFLVWHTRSKNLNSRNLNGDAKTCMYSSKFLASCIHKLEFKFHWSKFSWMETWMQNLYRVYRA